MAYEIPYPCPSFNPHRPHPHTAMVYDGTNANGDDLYRAEPGMYCAGYEPGSAEPTGGPDVAYGAYAGRTLVQVATGGVGKS
jgi:hypothetical protein